MAGCERKSFRPRTGKGRTNWLPNQHKLLSPNFLVSSHKSKGKVISSAVVITNKGWCGSVLWSPCLCLCAPQSPHFALYSTFSVRIFRLAAADAFAARGKWGQGILPSTHIRHTGPRIRARAALHIPQVQLQHVCSQHWLISCIPWIFSSFFSKLSLLLFPFALFSSALRQKIWFFLVNT